MKTTSFDELLARESAEFREAVDARFQEMLRTLPLAALRSECALTQAEIAKRLRISQAAVSKMEGRSDMLLSTLARYVKALAGTFSVAISVGDREFLIKQSGDAGDSFVLSEADSADALRSFAAASRRPQPHLEMKGARWDAHGVKVWNGAKSANDCLVRYLGKSLPPVESTAFPVQEAA